MCPSQSRANSGLETSKGVRSSTKIRILLLSRNCAQTGASRLAEFVTEYRQLYGKSETYRLVLGGVVTAALTLVAQQRGVHPVSGRVYAQTMSVQGAPWLDRREREDEENPDLAMRLLRIRKGATVADIGAGSGYISIRMAKIVGPMGKVYASDIQSGMLTLLQQNVTKAKLDNVVPVLGALDDPKLPADSIDLAIMVE